MRPKVALGIVLLAVLAAGGAVFLKRHSNAPAPAPVVSAPPAAAVSTQASLPAPSPIVSVAPAPPAVPPDQEIERLREWSRNNDPQSLSNILADLTNTNKDVREEAIDAVKQFGSTNAIPALKAAAMNATDTDEQIELLQAAQFLALPSINDIQVTPEQARAAQARSAQMRAQIQAQRQQRTPSPPAANAPTPAPAPQSP